jgi:phosphoenolpyruvate-protein phosphotransferase (PTS system enzyme I)
MDTTADPIPIVLNGTPASPGVAVGPVEVITHRDLEIPSEQISEQDIGNHIEKATNALSRVKIQLTGLQNTQKNREIIEVLDAQIQIVGDPELLNRVRDIIKKNKKSASFALYSAFNEYIHLLQESGQDWIKDRVVDIQSLRDKIIHQISGSDALWSNPKDAILFAEELSPTELIEFSDSKIGAIVMQHGGTTSHAVIIAQSLGIPCVVGVDWKHTQLEKTLIAAIDAESGEVIINPDKKVLARYRKREEQALKARKISLEVRKLPNKTACGSLFTLRGNIEFEEELQRVKEYGAEGIGLLRTETLFLRQGYFDIDKHSEFYQTVLKSTSPEPVIIRLLDVGGDKFPGKKIAEQNPFLGWRGIRMLLDEPELLQAQLRSALEAASRYPGRVQLLVPMISDISEITDVKKCLEKVRGELKNEGIDRVESLPVGIMVEVPSIALQADIVAKEVDFFSIGSNDLTQYTLAADRGNERVSRQFNSNHPSVWKLIKMAYDAADKASIPISVCGEMAGNPVMAAALLGLGINELSMNPASIPEVKKTLCKSEIVYCRELFDKLLHASGSKEADRISKNWRQKHLN